jgi:hypothetical protein
MKVSPFIITVLIVSSLTVSLIILTQPLARCDLSRYPPITGVVIEGAHIVSEGAYFRFWIFNNNSFSINVTVNGADTLSIPPKSGVDYDVIAPNISVPYEQVTYEFTVEASNGVLLQPKNVDFPVLVLNSSFTQIFDLAIPIILAIAAIAVGLVAIVIIRRRRPQKKLE